MTELNRQSGENEERIIEIEIERLRPFKEHPFQVKDDKEMFLLQESIEKYGILNPLIVRPVPDGYYEIISGHRRKHAAEKLGYRKVPVIIRVLSEDDSILSMVDSNLHRERISYSEKAFAYKLKNDVLKRKSGRKKSQVDHKTPRKRAIEIISEDCGDSPKQVQRYISLTKLIPEMLQKLDDEIISFCPAVEIAALSEKEQRELLVAMEYAQAIPSLSQAQRIRQLSKEKQLSLEKMEEIMCEVKKGEITRVAFTNEQLHKYFPNSYTPAMMKRALVKAQDVMTETRQELTSPDGAYRFTFYQRAVGEDNAQMYYTLTYKNRPVIEESKLGVLIENQLFESALGIPNDTCHFWCENLKLTGTEHQKTDEIWKPVYGERAEVRDCYNEMTLKFKKGEGKGNQDGGYDKRKNYFMNIIVRAYNEGVAFRYHFPEMTNGLFLHIVGEQTSFTMPEGTMAYYERWAQGPYELRPLKGWGKEESERPLTLKLPDGLSVALLEAEMVDYVRGKFRLSAEKPSTLETSLYSSVDIISPYSTPWRVIINYRFPVSSPP